MIGIFLPPIDPFQLAVAIYPCQSLAALLEHPHCNLDRVYLSNNNIGDEGAIIFANALASNRNLKTLNLYRNDITAEGWSCFSKVLCDTSSVNNTFLSNHTLEKLSSSNHARNVDSLLALNGSSEDKNQVAMKKIINRHQHFDMHPFFEWDLKVLPLAIRWFERARFIYVNNEAGIDKRKLDVIYQFIHAMPEVFEPVPGGR